MKKMILTGLISEHSFDNGGEARLYLVFNHGELRVPISEEAAEVVVGEMMKEAADRAIVSDTAEPVVEPTFDDQDLQDEVYDEDGVAQV